MAMADDLWRECASWLTRCKIIPSDHKANWPDSEIKVLAMTLRDGVLLCNLINFLDPNALDMKDFNRKPQMAQFLCSQNIKLFLETCKNYFGIKEADLFEHTMLYDLTNFHKVLITLSKLSQCRKVYAMHPNIPGFNTQISPCERSNSDEDIYKDLHTTNSRHKILKNDLENDTTPLTASMSVENDYDDEDEEGNNEKTNENTDNDDDSNLTENSQNLSDDLDNNSTKLKMLGTESNWTLNSLPEREAIEILVGISSNDEKIYEDLCYVTFSSSLPEVVMNN